MSRHIGDALPDSVFERLSGRDLDSVADRVILVCTVDEERFSHPAILSYFEVIAVDQRTIRIAMYADSRTTSNARRDGRLTLILMDQRLACYIKTEVKELNRSMRSTPHNAKLECRVSEVLLDEPDPTFEPGAYIATGVRYISPRRSEDLARAYSVIAELQE